ncbi:hypothetical protein DFQ26_002271 [Actinomortierella ambigua]|nr:hypothetical protein DFQ26_002271 [Actinomortierella ambigua]
MELLSTVKIVQDLLQVMADEGVSPVSSSVNRCLTDLIIGDIPVRQYVRTPPK